MKKHDSLAVALFSITGFAALLAGSVGCGQTSNPPAVAGSPTTTSSPGPIPTVAGTTSPYGTNPNYDFHFEVTGTGYATQVGSGTLQVATDSVLQITILAGNQMQVQGTGYTAGFDCEEFTVKVGDVVQTAQVARAGYTDYMLELGYGYAGDPCQSYATSWSYDFSGALSPGHQTVPISIYQTEIDNCRLAGYPQYGGCTVQTLYTTYQADGFAQVFTD